MLLLGLSHLRLCLGQKCEAATKCWSCSCKLSVLWQKRGLHQHLGALEEMINGSLGGTLRKDPKPHGQKLKGQIYCTRPPSRWASGNMENRGKILFQPRSCSDFKHKLLGKKTFQCIQFVWICFHTRCLYEFDLANQRERHLVNLFRLAVVTLRKQQIFRPCVSSSRPHSCLCFDQLLRQAPFLCCQASRKSFIVLCFFFLFFRQQND